MDEPFLTNQEYAIAECNANAEDIFNAVNYYGLKARACENMLG